MSTPEAMVYVVDDDPSVRKAIARLFRSVGLDVETFETARAFLDHERQDVPGCLVLDVQMPGLSGIELQEELGAHHVDLPIVFLTGHGDIPMTVKAMKAGAADFLPKPVNDERLLEVVSQAIDRHAEGCQNSIEVRDFLLRIETLTKREYEVMTFVIKGLLNKQTALEMGITEYTVKVHRGRVMEKTGVESVAELVRLWERSGLSEKEG